MNVDTLSIAKPQFDDLWKTPWVSLVHALLNLALSVLVRVTLVIHLLPGV